MKTTKAILITATFLFAITTALNAAELITPPMEQPNDVGGTHAFWCMAANVSTTTFSINIDLFDSTGTRIESASKSGIVPNETFVRRYNTLIVSRSYTCIITFGKSRALVVASAMACITDGDASTDNQFSCVAVAAE